VATDKRSCEFTIREIRKEQSANFVKCEVVKRSRVESEVMARGHMGGRPRKRSYCPFHRDGRFRVLKKQSQPSIARQI
jgi:hypothetical protein